MFVLFLIWLEILIHGDHITFSRLGTQGFPHRALKALGGIILFNSPSGIKYSINKGRFDNVILITLFVIFEKTCE